MANKTISFFVNDKQFDSVKFNHRYDMKIYDGNLCIIINGNQMQIEYKSDIDGEINIVTGTKNFFDGIKIKIEINNNIINIDVDDE